MRSAARAPRDCGCSQRRHATARRSPPATCAGRPPILFGGEGAGLPQDLLDASDERLTIPMRPPVESLNVAIAAALILYEAVATANE